LTATAVRVRPPTASVWVLSLAQACEASPEESLTSSSGERSRELAVAEVAVGGRFPGRRRQEAVGCGRDLNAVVLAERLVHKATGCKHLRPVGSRPTSAGSVGRDVARLHEISAAVPPGEGDRIWAVTASD
jgi:hypothetical protein